MICADDIDFRSVNERKKQVLLTAAETVFLNRNLNENQDKTEHTVFERRNRNTKGFRNVKKVGTLLRDDEDIIRHKGW